MAITYSPSGVEFAVGGNDYNVTIYNIITNEIIKEYVMSSPVLTIVYSPIIPTTFAPDSGRYLFVGGYDQRDTTFVIYLML